MSKQISYGVRDFASLRDELVKLTKQYYPDLVSNFNDASIYSVLLDLNAAVSDNLHFHIDRVWQETMLDFAQEKKSPNKPRPQLSLAIRNRKKTWHWKNSKSLSSFM